MKHVRLFALALLAAFAAAPSGAVLAQGYGQGYHGWSTSGVIAVVNKTNIKLQDGRNIFLKNGTVISPRGTTLSPGMHIHVQGTHGGNGAINAGYVQVTGTYHGHYYSH